jgi:hypothetical protein
MGLDPNKVFGDARYPAVAAAVMRGDVLALESNAAKAPIDWRTAGAKGLTLGHLALHAPTPAMLDYVLRKGADPIARIEGDNTIPHYSLGKNDAQGVRTDAWLAVLLRHGVSPDLTGPAGHPLVVQAVGYGNLKAIELLARSGAKMSQTAADNDGTAIHHALTVNDLGMAARIAELGGDPRIKDGHEMNAAENYCRFNHGQYEERRRADFERLKAAFLKYGLSIPCGF